MSKRSEKDLYEPTRRTLESMFAPVGECYLEISANGISEEMKQHLDDPAVTILPTESKKPDIFGYILAKISEQSESKRLIVAEVKRGYLSLDDLYQLKKYAEILDAYYAFLVSPLGFNEIRRRFLMKRHGPLSLPGYRRITVMRFTHNTLERDGDLSYMDPFKPEYTSSDTE